MRKCLFISKCIFFIESRAICRYLEKKYKGRGTELIPKGHNALGLFEQGVAIETSNFDSLATQIVGEKIFKKYNNLFA